MTELRGPRLDFSKLRLSPANHVKAAKLVRAASREGAERARFLQARGGSSVTNIFEACRIVSRSYEAVFLMHEFW
jgi:hypothetical protein